MKTVVGLFDDFTQASQAVRGLEGAGIPRDDVSIIANNQDGRFAAVDNEGGSSGETGHAIGHDALVGAEIGGAVGLVVGLTGLAIPGLGWIASAGWFAGALLGAGTGALIGGLVGALTHVGVPEEDAGYYSEGVRRGGSLVAVRAQDQDAHRIADLLGQAGAVNIEERAAQYRNEGWSPEQVRAMDADATSGAGGMAGASLAGAGLAGAAATSAGMTGIGMGGTPAATGVPSSTYGTASPGSTVSATDESFPISDPATTWRGGTTSTTGQTLDEGIDTPALATAQGDQNPDTPVGGQTSDFGNSLAGGPGNTTPHVQTGRGDAAADTRTGEQRLPDTLSGGQGGNTTNRPID